MMKFKKQQYLQWLFLFIFAGFAFSNFYEAEVGDTYYDIGKKFKVNYIVLAKLNDNKKLKAGDKIKLPNWVHYEIAKGDTLIGISQKYRVKIEDIKKLNPNVKTLLVGMKIKIPCVEFSQPNVEFKEKAEKKEEPPNPNINKKLKNSLEPSVSQKQKIKIPDFVWPVNGEIDVGYGEKDSIMNYGVYFKTKNSKVRVSAKGIILLVEKMRGYGDTVIVRHESGFLTVYSGFEKIEVMTGDELQAGESLGRVDGDIFFFSIFHEGSPGDPIEYLEETKHSKELSRKSG